MAVWVVNDRWWNRRWNHVKYFLFTIYKMSTLSIFLPIIEKGSLRRTKKKPSKNVRFGPVRPKSIVQLCTVQCSFRVRIAKMVKVLEIFDICPLETARETIHIVRNPTGDPWYKGSESVNISISDLQTEQSKSFYPSHFLMKSSRLYPDLVHIVGRCWEGSCPKSNRKGSQFVSLFHHVVGTDIPTWFPVHMINLINCPWSL